MKLFFIRHGESEANILRIFSNRGWQHGLTGQGREQVSALADRLVGSRASRIYTSPLLRAVETAEILAGRLGIPYEITAALREFDTGINEGRSDAERWARHSQVLEAWRRGELDSRIEGGESLVDIQGRFLPFLESLAAEAGEGGTCILVGHGGLYEAVLPLVLENITAEFYSRYPLKNAEYALAELRPDGWVCTEWAERLCMCA